MELEHTEMLAEVLAEALDQSETQEFQEEGSDIFNRQSALQTKSGVWYESPLEAIKVANEPSVQSSGLVARIVF